MAKTTLTTLKVRKDAEKLKHALLVRVQNGPTTLKIDLQIYYKVGQIASSNSTAKYRKGNDTMYLQKDNLHYCP